MKVINYVTFFCFEINFWIINSIRALPAEFSVLQRKNLLKNFIYFNKKKFVLWSSVWVNIRRPLYHKPRLLSHIFNFKKCYFVKWSNFFQHILNYFITLLQIILLDTELQKGFEHCIKRKLLIFVINI